MKNIKKIILLLSLYFIFFSNLSADVTESTITFKLLDNFYSDVTPKYENNTYVFYYNNNLLNMNLTDEQLNSIISQKSGNGSSRLTYYETLNIKVKPVEGTDFESLKNKNKFFRANGGGLWVNSITHNQTMESTAQKLDLDNNFWPWGFKIQYRLTPNDTFTSNIPSTVNLNNKTLEEQLATLLNLDIDTNPDAVIDQYKYLWRFNPLPDGYTFLIRFDFFDNKPDSLPTLKENSTNEYLTSSLKHLDSKYVAIKYDRSGELPTISYTDLSNRYKHNYLLLIIPISILLIGGTIIYIKQKNIKYFQKKT